MRGEVPKIPEENEGEPTWWKKHEEAILNMPIDLQRVFQKTADMNLHISKLMGTAPSDLEADIQRDFDIGADDLLTSISEENKKARTFLADEILDYHETKGTTIGALRDLLPFLRDRVHTQRDLVKKVLMLTLQASSRLDPAVRQLIINIGISMRTKETLERARRTSAGDKDLEEWLHHTTAIVPLVDKIIGKLEKGKL